MLCKTFYSTKQKKPNRKHLTERVLLPFHTHSRSLSVSVRYPFPYPFHICSVPVPYPFPIRSVLFCSCSDSVPWVSVLGTRSEERGFRELVYKNASKDVQGISNTWLKLSRMRSGIQTINVHLCVKNVSLDSYLKNTGRGQLGNIFPK